MLSLLRLCQRQNLPSALLDARLQVLWCARSALDRWPLLRQPDGMLLLFPGLPLVPGEAAWFTAPFPHEGLSVLLLPAGSRWLALFSPPSRSSSSWAGSREADAFSWQFRQPLGELAGDLSLLEARLSSLGIGGGWEASCSHAFQNSCRLLRGWENLSLVLGGETPRTEALSLWREAESVLEAVRLALPPPQLRLDWRFPGKETVVLADRRWLGRILCNLLSNSCLFGGGAVTVRGKAAAGQGVILLRDRGPGFPSRMNLAEGPFPGESFPREGGSASRAGLGLCACRRALGEMGGRFLLSSGRKGALVSFALPLAPAGAAPSPVPDPASYLRGHFSPVLVGLSDLAFPV